MEKRLVVTIGRQFGSRGRAVGEKLAQKLGIAVYGREELMEIARGTEDYEEVREFYEEEPVNSLLYAIAMYNFENGVGNVPFRRIREFCKEKSCVIIGRCGNTIFRDDEDAVSVFIHARDEVRIKRIMELEGLNEAKAKKFMQEEDDRRASFHKYYAQQEWGRAKDYEISLDSGVLGIDGTADVLLDYLRRRGKC